MIPFIHNYVFSKADVDKHNICKVRNYPEIWFRTTYVQINDGYVFHFRQRHNYYYLLKVERLCIRTS